MFRTVQLPAPATGRLYLHSMPGRYEPWPEALQALREEQMEHVVCLAPPAEVAHKSPAYAQAAETGQMPCRLTHFAIPDFGVPDDTESFRQLAATVAEHLRGGRRVLIHCGAGIGRTGTLATAVLLELGESLPAALTAVAHAGAGPETEDQEDLVFHLARQRQGED